MNVCEGEDRSWLEDTAVRLTARFTGDSARPRGNIARPAEDGDGCFHDGQSCSLHCRERGRDDLRSGTSLKCKLGALIFPLRSGTPEALSVLFSKACLSSVCEFVDVLLGVVVLELVASASEERRLPSNMLESLVLIIAVRKALGCS